MIGLVALLGQLKLAAVGWIVVIGGAGIILIGTVAPVPASPAAHPVAQPVAREANGCSEARAVRDAAFARLEHDYRQALADLRALRDGTARDAAAQNKVLSEETLDGIEQAAQAELAARAEAARAELVAIADLHKCDGDDADSGQIFDIADLRNRYNAIVDRALADFKRTVRGAADRLAAALAAAPVRVPQRGSQGSSSQGD